MYENGEEGEEMKPEAETEQGEELPEDTEERQKSADSPAHRHRALRYHLPKPDCGSLMRETWNFDLK